MTKLKNGKMKNIYGKEIILHKWQIEALNILNNKNRVIITAPTGAGKTIVAYKWADIFNKDNRIIFTAPIKALSNERYKELKKIFGNREVGINTGDIKKNIDARIICCTQEIFTLYYANSKMYNTVIIDEIHYIFANRDRNRAYLKGVIEAVNDNYKIMLISATIGYLNSFKQYIEGITEDSWELYEYKDRIVELYEIENNFNYIDNIHEYIDEYSPILIYLFSVRGINMTISNLVYYLNSDKKYYNEIKKIAGKYKIKDKDLIEGIATYRIAPYYGSLLIKEKLFIEEIVRKGYIKIIVGTDALSLGINLPIKTVLYGQIVKYYDGPISKREFEQMKGRAGRLGLYDIGYYGYIYTGFEARGYTREEIEEIYKNLRDGEMIEFEIDPVIDVRRILKEDIDEIEDEIDFIYKIQYPKKYSKKDIEEKIYSIIDEINDRLDDIIVEYDDIYDKNILVDLLYEIYFQEYSIEMNINILEHIINNNYRIDCKMLTYRMRYNSRSEGIYLKYLLQFRKYIKTIAKRKYVRNNIKILNKEIIEEEINKLDEFALNI